MSTMLMKLTWARWLTAQQPGDQAINTLVLIDRESDMITPMLTQLTYGGMLDDMFGIKDGVANIPGKLVPGKHQYTAEAHLEHRVPLNPSDPVFVSVRDLPLAAAEPALKRSLYAGESSSANTSGFGGGDQNDFFSGEEYRRESDVSVNASQQPATPAAEQRIKLHTALVQHLLHTHTQHATFIRQVQVEHALIQGSISYEEAMEFIDEMLYRRQPFARVIRFLSLVSGLCGGLRRFSHYKRELLQVYGFEYLFSLENLEKGGLLKGNNNTASVTSFVGAGRTLASKAASVAGITATKATDSHWDTVVRALDIVPVFTDDKREDSTFVDAGLSDIFGGIVPVTVRLVQKALFPPNDGWLSLEGTLKDVPGGPLFEAYQPTGRENDDRRVKNVLVMFVGGITLPEIAGVRFLAKHYNDNRRAGSAELRLLIGTSRIAGGDTLIHDLADVQKNMIKDFQLNLGK
jgi:vacuolar protein sorting-associated protein 33A